LKSRPLLNHSRSTDPILQRYRATQTLFKRALSNPWKHFQMTSFSNFQLRNCINLNGKRVYPILLLFFCPGLIKGPWKSKIEMQRVREAHAQMPTNNCKTFTQTHAKQSYKKITQIRQKSKSNHTKIIEPIELPNCISAVGWL